MRYRYAGSVVAVRGREVVAAPAEVGEAPPSMAPAPRWLREKLEAGGLAVYLRDLA